MVKVIWTNNAIEDLNDIGEYISKESPKYAELTVQKLFISVDILENHPLAGKMIPELNNKDLRELIRGNFRIVYHVVDEYRVDIITVHRTSRLLSNVLGEDQSREI